MFPVLLSFGKFSVSSFGFFLALAFLTGIFLVWRLARAWELDEEKVLDLMLLVFLGGLIGARVYFVLENAAIFATNLLGIILIHKYPGFSFWGAFLGGWLSLFYFVRFFKMNFWQIADLASVGLIGGLILANFGCLLGGCDVGVPSSFLGVEMVGKLGKRFPVQAIEALLLLVVFLRLWPQTLHFHFSGKIVSKALIMLGSIKFITEFFKENQNGGELLSLILILLGIVSYYLSINLSLKGGNKSFIKDLWWVGRFLISTILDRATQKWIIEKLKKSWYTQTVSFNWRLRSIYKLLRRARVRFTPKDIRGA